MIYTVERAELVSEQLRKFTSGYAHHVVGHFANLGFWLDEAESALACIDRHNDRFDALKAAQQDWVDRHQTQVPTYGFCRICGGKCEFDDGDSTTRPPVPRNAATRAKSDSRRELVDAVYYFLARCCRMGLLTEQEMTQHCNRFATSIDPADLRTS